MPVIKAFLQACSKKTGNEPWELISCFPEVKHVAKRKDDDWLKDTQAHKQHLRSQNLNIHLKYIVQRTMASAFHSSPNCRESTVLWGCF